MKSKLKKKKLTKTELSFFNPVIGNLDQYLKIVRSVLNIISLESTTIKTSIKFTIFFVFFFIKMLVIALILNLLKIFIFLKKFQSSNTLNNLNCTPTLFKLWGYTPSLNQN